MSFWQESPGDWRVRLRGQPVRTDLSLEQADTGIVRLEANLRQAPELRQMPVHLDLEWREAQLGQLTRLLLGSDAGWRGDLTGELHLDGTADAAQIKTRLRATGVHRAEFAPAAPMDFDANCTLVAHFSTRAIDNLLCDSPLGDGHIRLAGKLAEGMPGQDGLPSFSVELDRISVAAGLDALRTVRSGLAPGLEATGSASGKITYAPDDRRTGKAGSRRPCPLRQELIRQSQGPLTGSFTVRAFNSAATASASPFRIPKLLLTRARPQASRPAHPGSGGHRGHSRRRSRPAHGFHAPRALRLPAHGARPGLHQPGQGTGARGRHRQCRCPGRACRRPRLRGPDRRRSLAAIAQTPISVGGPDLRPRRCPLRRRRSVCRQPTLSPEP